MDAAHRWEKEERTIWSRKGIVFILFCVLLSVLPSGAFAQSEPVTTGSSAIDTAYPPVPKAYFNDYAGVTSVKTQGVLNTQLADFDKQTQNQVVVAIFKRKDSAATLADYCTGMFNKWGVGQKGKNNGVILFVFMDDHLLRISTGLGMDKILPDDECEQIIDRVVIGKMRKRQYDVAFSSAVDAILDAILIKQGPKTDGSSSGR